MKKYKTIKNVILPHDGNPIIEKVSEHSFDVLVRSDKGCIGCFYNSTKTILPKNCISQCRDLDHIMWIHYDYSDIPKSCTIVKRAHLFDTLIDENGGKWIILSLPNGRFDVSPKFAEPI